MARSRAIVDEALASGGLDQFGRFTTEEGESPNLRRILLDMIEEYARHGGHADIIRESIDGGTAFPLLAAAEGWPETPWLKPWQPADPA
jgi:Protein of unknown function (DUF664)